MKSFSSKALAEPLYPERSTKLGYLLTGCYSAIKAETNGKKRNNNGFQPRTEVKYRAGVMAV